MRREAGRYLEQALFPQIAQVFQQRRLLRQVLQIVDDHQQVCRVERLDQVLLGRCHGLFGQSERPGHGQEGGIVNRGEIDEGRAATKMARDLLCHLQGQPRLPRSAHTGEGHQTGCLECVVDRATFGRSTGKGCQGSWQG